MSDLGWPYDPRYQAIAERIYLATCPYDSLDESDVTPQMEQDRAYIKQRYEGYKSQGKSFGESARCAKITLMIYAIAGLDAPYIPSIEDALGKPTASPTPDP